MKTEKVLGGATWNGDSGVEYVSEVKKYLWNGVE